MKTILFYDNETNDLPKWSLPSEHPSQPHVTQLAAELCVEETGEVLRDMNLLILPDGWTIPEDLQQLTGITMERAHADGIPANLVIDMFIDMWADASLRCGHNESFDMRMIRIELMRHSRYSGEVMPGPNGDIPFADYWKQAPAYCTQSNSTKIINLPPTEKMIAAKRRGPKSPNLAEAYKHFTGKDLEGAHDAMNDVRAAKAVYYGIKAHNAQAAA